MALDPLTVSQVVQQNYQPGAFRLQLLAHGNTDVYRIQRASSPDWVVRVYSAPVASQGMTAAARLALFLRIFESSCYPAERIVQTVAGLDVAQPTTGQYLVTTFLGHSIQCWQPQAGEVSGHTSSQPDMPSLNLTKVFYAAGSCLGELHTLPLETSFKAALPLAAMRPDSELAWAASTLDQMANQVPPRLQDLYSTLKLRLQHLSRFETCPHTWIHSDCHLGNMVVTPAGEIRLIDWESAGMGSAVTDLGQLLSWCLLEDKPDMAYIRAAIHGYARYRTLNPVELAVLVDAIQLRTLILLATSFKQRCQSHFDPAQLFYGRTYEQWLSHYQMAHEIAGHARNAFAEAGSESTSKNAE